MTLETAGRGVASALTLVALAFGSNGCSDSSGSGLTGDDPDGSGNEGVLFADTRAANGVYPPSVNIVEPKPNAFFPAGNTVTLIAHVSDDYDKPEALTISWTSDVGGNVASARANATGVAVIDAPVTLAAGTHRLTVTVTDSDNMVGSDSVTAVINGLPSAPGVRIEPPEPTTTDDLTALIDQDSQDPNRGIDELTYGYVWLRNGSPSGIIGPMVPAAQTQRGDTWAVQVSAFDGHANGEVGRAQVTIANRPPRCNAVQVLPSLGAVDSPFECRCTDWRDADGDDPDGDSCSWLVDGVPVTGVDACDLPPGHTSKGEKVRCGFTPSDGADQGETAWSLAATVVNSAPTPPSTSLTPTSGGVIDTFSCELLTEGSDADNDPITHIFGWIVAGYENPAAFSPSLSGSDLARDAFGTPPAFGDTLQCFARASDGSDQSPKGLSNVVVLGNSPPTGGIVLLTPADPGETSLVTCVATDAEDTDGDLVTWLYTWFVNGEEVQGATSSTIDGAHFDKGDVVTCAARPTDGKAIGPAVNSKNQATVVNTLPAVATATASPEVATKAGSFQCTYAGWSDADPADIQDVKLHWVVVEPNGDHTTIAGATNATLAAAPFTKGTALACIATPYNGAAAGTPATSNVVTVGNSPPTVALVEVTPSDGSICSLFTCVASGVSDPDQDSVTLAYRWQLNDDLLQNATSQLTGVALKPGDVLHCSARPTDGATDGGGLLQYGAEVQSDPVTVSNATPTVATPDLTPLEPSPIATVTCTAKGFTDADACQSLVAVEYQWLVNGLPVEADQATLTMVPYPPGTTVACQTRGSDGWTWSPWVLSNTVTVASGDPVVTIIAPQGAGGDVTCTLVKEGVWSEPLSYSYTWTFNGGPEQVLGATLSASQVEHCDVLTCKTTATATGASLTSNIASASMAFGSDCDDTDACTTDACDPVGGCDHVPFEGPCDDGDACTEGESCAGGTCDGGVQTTCDDANDCTADSCVSPGGCTFVAIEGSCGPGGAGVCIDAACCLPDCDGRDCGSDGCGGSCGECADGFACADSDGMCIGPDPGTVFVPGGPFWMGCNQEPGQPGCPPMEEPLHLVELPLYQIDLFEVSAGEFSACFDDFGCAPAGTVEGCNVGKPDKADHPANCLDWSKAVAYCEWAGKRLCTEAEWEKGARGNDVRRYPWGAADPTCNEVVGDLDGLGAGCGAGTTDEVGTRPDGVSPYGLFDMAGNVWEWVHDRFAADYYFDSPLYDPQGPEAGGYRVRRGGSYLDSTQEHRASNREPFSPATGRPEMGFRCCKDGPQ